MKATAKRRFGRPSGPRKTQRGLALMEMLLLTVPLCILGIVLASAVAATATSRNKSMWKASLKAQQATKDGRCGAPILLKPNLSPDYGKHMGGYGKAVEIATIGMPITRTGTKTEQVTEKVAPFYFEQTADKMFSSRSKETRNSATFPCNEPGDPGDSDRNKYKAILIGIAGMKAREMY